MDSLSSRKWARTPAFRVRSVAKHAFFVVSLNSFVSVGITASGSATFFGSFIHAQFIGLIIWMLIDGGRYIFAMDGVLTPTHSSLLVMGAVPAGYIAGTGLADWSVGLAPWASFGSSLRATITLLLMSFAAAGVATYYILTQEMIAKKQLAESDAQRHASEARLRLLESQLEPHMLFNTLATMRAMIDGEPQEAKNMLDNMVDYFRGTLDASLKGEHSVQSEFERLHSYLELMSCRFGSRLFYSFSLPREVIHLVMPALLLQPLVENSIRHGLEPKEGGGWIKISASLDREILVLSVEDNGVGMDEKEKISMLDTTVGEESSVIAIEDNEAMGFGLASVRRRLAETFGEAARLEVVSYPSGGTLVTVRLGSARVSQ